MKQEIKVTDYEIMFTVHTGITILIQKVEALNKSSSENILFYIHSDTDIAIDTPSTKLIIIDLKKDYINEAYERGFIMLYELEYEEVIRCTPCQIRPA